MSLRFDKVMDEHEAGQMNALQLAYLGDSVWEMIIRFELVFRKYSVRHMHENCIGLVNAHSQAMILQRIQSKLTEKENEIVRRGRNSHAKHPSPRNQNPDEYSYSTGFEALLGFLYLTGQNSRIEELMKYIKEVIEDGGREKIEG